MSKNDPANLHHTYEVLTHSDDNGDMIVPLPPQLLSKLGWKEGDQIDIQIDDKGKIYLKKLSK